MKGHNFDHGRGDVCKKCGKIHRKHAWNKGLSTSTDERVARYGRKVSRSQRQRAEAIGARSREAWAERHRRAGKAHVTLEDIHGEERAREIKEKLSRARSAAGGRPHSEATKAKMSRSKREWFADPENARRFREVMREAFRSPEVREEMSRRATRVWEEKRRRGVEELYGIELPVKPGRLSDHRFARYVLIEKRENYRRYAYTEHTGLREHPHLSPRFPSDDDLVDRPRWPEREEPDDSA